MKIYKKLCALLVVLTIACASVLAIQDNKNQPGKDNRKPKIPVSNKNDKKPDKKPDNE